MQLQTSIKEARDQLQQEQSGNHRLLRQLHEREKAWRAAWSRKSGQDNNDAPPTIPPFGQVANQHQYGASSPMTYQPTVDTTIPNGQYSAGSYQTESPTIAYPGVNVDGSGDPNRAQKYSTFFNGMNGSRDGSWTQTNVPNASSAADGLSSESRPDMTFSNRFEDQKLAIDSAYIFPSSRSISPPSASPTTTASTTSVTAPFSFGFTDNAHDRTNFEYRRLTSTHAPELTLHGGTGGISLTGIADSVRYRLGTRRSDTDIDQTLLPVLPPLPASGLSSITDRAGSDCDSSVHPQSRLRSRRNTLGSRSSRSPSPEAMAPPSGSTLAVIKAQAFGALRRTRTRMKKPDEASNSKVAIDIESRGMGVRAKRQRLDDDLDDEDPGE